MAKIYPLVIGVLWTVAVSCLVWADAQHLPPTAQVLLPIRADALNRVTPTSAQVTVASRSAPDPGITITIQPGAEIYPGIRIRPAGAVWNLSAFGHVDARVVNTGAQPLTLALRVDNAGDWHNNPWNTELLSLKPGQTRTIRVIFGYAYGYKPGYALKPAGVVNLMLFTGKADGPESFRLESLIAGGRAGEKPPVAPDDVRTAPPGGVLLGPGGPALDPTTQIVSQGAQTDLTGSGKREELRMTFPVAPAGSSESPSVTVMPIGRWDLRDYLEVQVTLRNGTSSPVTPRVRLETNGGASDWVTATTPLPPGATRQITVPFAASTLPDLSKPETLDRVTSDAVSGVTISAGAPGGPCHLILQSIRAALPLPTLPSWLGQRPPVDGAWVKTLDEEFNGSTINIALWRIYGENYWDKSSHWSKDNVVLGQGVVRLRYQKKTGFHNDDPTQKQTDYASGFLDTYGKWHQRYGYFEARMKLPTAPGLWPAFWMVPDRGPASGPEQWKRQDTYHGGMEFDIMEHLTRWGPYRYNIAMHWDGYGADHKSNGSDKIYLQPDKEGYITAGLLWTPGAAVYYGNGRPVLRWENPRIGSVPEMILLTLPQGGWDNSPIEDARLPDDFTIDYVRVWQRQDLASPDDGNMPRP